MTHTLIIAALLGAPWRASVRIDVTPLTEFKP